MSHSLTEPNDYIEEICIELWYKKIQFLDLKQKSDFELLLSEAEKVVRAQLYQDGLNLRYDGKNNEKATEIRNQGNKMFHPRVKRYIEAIKYYNESIAYAEKGSEQRALAYSNRAIICLKLHRYEDCLENIRLARESNYPIRLAAKLKKLENDVKQALKEANNNKKPSNGPAKHAKEPAERELKLSYAGYTNMPQVANCLQLHCNDEYGRHVVTDRPLNPGDVVMIDKPFVAVLHDTLRHVRCNYCHHEKPFTLIPCEGCVVAMYCSEECLSKAHQKYHRYECPVIRELWRFANDIPAMALRTVFKAIATFDHDLVALKEHLDNLDETGVNAFTMDWKAAAPKDIYDTMHVLVTNRQHQDDQDLTYTVLLATIVHLLMMERTELGAICEIDVQMKKLLFDLIFRYLQISKFNHQQLRFMDFQVDEGVFQNSYYALGCCPLISMLNHSCAPNLARITLRDGRCAVLVVHPIAEGDQLFVCYGVHHLGWFLADRQNNMKRRFCFRCRCEACQFDYPTIPEFSILGSCGPKSCYYLLMHRDLVSHDACKVIKWMPTLRAYITQNEKKYPTLEVCNSIAQLVRCFRILYSFTSKMSSYWKYCKP